MNSPLHHPRSAVRIKNTASWLLFAAAAGAVNATAFLGCERFVSHVTGTVTQIGADIGAWALMAEYFLVLVCFIAGAALSVPIIRRTRSQWGFTMPLFLSIVLLVSVAGLGTLGAFGHFASDIETPGSFAFLSLLSLAMGLQNATVTSATSLALRTTHMTGPASDLGVHLATVFEVEGADREAALRLAALRGFKILAFIAGAALAVPFTKSFGYLAFLMPALMLLLATIQSLTNPQGENTNDYATDFRRSCTDSVT